MTATRRSLLTAALAFTVIQWHGDVPPAARALSTWMNTWIAVGAVVGGMQRLGYVVEFRLLADNWRVNFRLGDENHVAGSAWESTVWVAVQRAAWAVLKAQ